MSAPQINLAVLSPDNELRRQNEAEINSLRLNYPNEFIDTLIQILGQCPDVQVRTLVSVLLRNFFSQSSPLGLWDKLTPQTQHLSKSSLLQLVTTETIRPIKTRISEAIGELGANILSHDENAWPELKDFLFSGATGQDPTLQAQSLHIIAGLFTFIHEQLSANQEALFAILQRSLSAQDILVRLYGLEATCSLLSVVESKETAPYQPLLPSILDSVLYVVKNSEADAKDALDFIIELAEAEPKFFKAYIQGCMQLVEELFQVPTEDIAIKNLSLEFMVAILERILKKLENGVDVAEFVVNKIFGMMVEIPFDVDNDWASPPEGFDVMEGDEGDLEIDYVSIGKKLLRKLVSSVGDTQMLPIIMPKVQTTLTQEDWRYVYTGLMVISELSQYLNEESKIAQLMPILVQYSQSEHPKVRYGVFKCITNISQDYESQFQSQHSESIVPLLQQGLQDPVSRVKSQAAWALANYFESAGETLSSTYASTFIPILINLISPGSISIVIEQALTALSSIAEASKQHFAQYYTQLLPFLFQVVEHCQTNEYTRLKGKAIECMTLLCFAAGPDLFRPNAPQVINLIKQTQQLHFQEHDPIRNSVFTAWERIAQTLKKEFAPYFAEILPGLLQMCAITPQMSVSQAPEETFDIVKLMSDDRKKQTITTTEIEDKELALQTILQISNTLKDGFAPYVDAVSELALPLIDYSPNENIRSTVANLLGSMIISVRIQESAESLQKCIEMARVFLTRLWETACSEYDTQTLISQLSAIKTILIAPNTPFLTAEDIQTQGEKAIKLLEESLKKRERNAILQQMDSDGEDEEAFVEFQQKEEEQLHTDIAEIFGSLFQSHPQQSLEIAEFLYKNVLSRFLGVQQPASDHKFAIFIIDDMVEHLAPYLDNEKWQALAEVLVKFAESQSDSVRQAACYGIGMLASKSPAATFGPWTETIMSALERALQIPKTGNTRTYGYAKDNTVAAIGRIIKHQAELINAQLVISAWIQFLPLKFDREEAVQMHELLADAIEANPAMVYGEDLSNLGKVISIFGEILETKLINHETREKLQRIVNGMKNEQQFQSVLSQLDPHSQSKLSKLFA